MWVSRASVVLALVASSLALPSTAAQAAPGFIEAQGTHLSLDGEPFHFTGLNVYNANSDGWCWFEYNDAEFAQALTNMGPGTNVIRAWFFQPLATTAGGQRDWTRFDRTLQIAGQHGVRVIVTLTDQWGECGSTGANPYKDRGWYEGGYETEVLPDSIVPYRDWVAEVVTRYKDDPNVAFWQLINEAEVNEVIGGVQQACPPGNGPADILRSWAQDVGGLVKSIDSNHLVSLGTIGGGQCGAQGAQYESVHDIPEVDLCEYHDYGSPSTGIPGDQYNGLQVRLDQCAAIDKPLFIGEAGIIPDDVGGTLQDRADAFAAKIDAQFDAGVVGFLGWAWSALGSTTDNYDIGPNDPTLDVLAASQVEVPPEITRLSAGGHHACFVTDAGAAKCWGYNASGQLGDGTTTDRSRPVQVVGLESGVAAISASLGHTCALMTAGGVKCWGLNDSGQISDGTTTDRLTPTDVEGLTSGVVSVSTGSYYTCALTTGGGAKCWGANWNGQLGDGSASNRSTPVNVTGLTSGVAAISGTHGSGAHTCALTEAGQARCWGRNWEGQLGDGSTYAYTPTAVDVTGLPGPALAISLGMWQTCALTLDTGVSCWGGNFNGQLGDGTVVERHTPTAVSGLSNGVAEISAGHMSTCAVTVSGGAKCWGANGSGQLGDGTVTDKSVPGAVDGLSSGVHSVSTGYEFACALMESGIVKCWGSNNHGQLGRGSIGGQATLPADVDFNISAPGAPTNVQATAGDGAATVIWSSPGSDGGSAITGYTITSEPDGITASVGPGETQAIVPGLTNGVSYTFTVFATNGIGDGPESAPSNAVVPRTVPGAPTAVNATAGNASATISWTAPASNGGASISGYTVVASPGGISRSVGNVTTMAFTGLQNGTAYTFQVRATNAAGDGSLSDPSNQVTPSGAVPTAPRSPTAVAGNQSARVTWQAPLSDGGSSIQRYTVTSVPGGFTAQVDGSTLTAIVTGLTNGTSYRFSVVATNGAGDSPPSVLSNAVTPRNVPGPPTNVTATAGNASATVRWTAPTSPGGSSITNYVVTASPGGATKTVGNVLQTTMSGLTNGTTYTFTVVARNGAGNSLPSAPSNAVTPIGPPSAPRSVTATAGNASATVSWLPPTSTGGSAIQTYTVSSNVGGFTRTVAASEIPVTFTGLTNGVAYRFRVVATNAAGTGPASSLSPAVTPSGLPGAPPGVSASPGNGSATVAWSAAAPNGSAITSYIVVCSCGSRTTVGATVRSALVGGLTNGQSYTFTVIAHNANGDGPPSSTSNPVVPSATLSSIVFASNRPGSAGYDIYYANSNMTGLVRLTTTDGQDTDPSLS